MKLKHLIVLLIPLIVCSCSRKSQEPTPSSRVIDSNDSILISLETTNSNPTEETTTVIETEAPTYEVSECEFIVDSLNRTISAHYDDTTDNEEGYIVDIDLTYRDYGVSEASVYETSNSTSLGYRQLDLDGTEWQEVLGAAMSPISSYNTDPQRQVLSLNCALASEVYSVEDNSDVSSLVSILNEYYDVFPYYYEYVYPIVEMNSYDSEEYRIYSNPDSGSTIDRITLRTSLDGLPVGVPQDNGRMQLRLTYGDYYGSYFGVEDDFMYDYSMGNTMVDFRYYNFDLEMVPDSTSSVIPLEDCIENAFPGFLNEAAFAGTNYCQVYDAELLYLPFSVGCTELGDFGFDVYYVPVWAIYTASAGDSKVLASAVYLNALTGELVSHGL